MGNIKKLLVLAILMILQISSISYAENVSVYNIGNIEKSEEFKKWEQLPEEERENTLQPALDNIEFKDSIKRSRYNQLIALGESESESYYNLKDELLNIRVKNQKKTESCWAFSFTSVLETTIGKKMNKIANEFSPMHIEYKTIEIFNRQLSVGGNPWLALAYALNRKWTSFRTRYAIFKCI